MSENNFLRDICENTFVNFYMFVNRCCSLIDIGCKYKNYHNVKQKWIEWNQVKIRIKILLSLHNQYSIW